MHFEFGEFFSGPGGMALGAHLAAEKVGGISLKHAWANDYDAATCKTYVRNIPGATEESVLCADVRQIDAKQLRTSIPFST